MELRKNTKKFLIILLLFCLLLNGCTLRYEPLKKIVEDKMCWEAENVNFSISFKDYAGKLYFGGYEYRLEVQIGVYYNDMEIYAYSITENTDARMYDENDPRKCDGCIDLKVNRVKENEFVVSVIYSDFDLPKTLIFHKVNN